MLELEFCQQFYFASGSLICSASRGHYRRLKKGNKGVKGLGFSCLPVVPVNVVAAIIPQPRSGTWFKFISFFSVSFKDIPQTVPTTVPVTPEVLASAEWHLLPTGLGLSSGGSPPLSF